MRYVKKFLGQTTLVGIAIYTLYLCYGQKLAYQTAALMQQ